MRTGTWFTLPFPCKYVDSSMPSSHCCHSLPAQRNKNYNHKGSMPKIPRHTSVSMNKTTVFLHDHHLHMRTNPTITKIIIWFFPVISVVLKHVQERLKKIFGFCLVLPPPPAGLFTRTLWVSHSWKQRITVHPSRPCLGANNKKKSQDTFFFVNKFGMDPYRSDNHMQSINQGPGRGQSTSFLLNACLATITLPLTFASLPINRCSGPWIDPDYTEHYFHSQRQHRRRYCDASQCAYFDCPVLILHLLSTPFRPIDGWTWKSRRL